MERATGKEIRGVIENTMGRSSEEELGMSKQRVEALWHEEGFTEESVETPVSALVGMDIPEEIRDTLERAEKALSTTPTEDREEMIDLMEDLRDALKQGRAEDAGKLKRELDEILFYLE